MLRFIVMVSLVIIGCTTANTEPIRSSQGKLSLKSILVNPATYEKQEVLIEGFFLGWKGKCPQSMPITRSDWMLEDETGCIYVTGQIPVGISAINPKKEKLIVYGQVEITKEGKPIIKAAKIKHLSKNTK